MLTGAAESLRLLRNGSVEDGAHAVAQEGEEVPPVVPPMLVVPPVVITPPVVSRKSSRELSKDCGKMRGFDRRDLIGRLGQDWFFPTRFRSSSRRDRE